MSLEALGAGTAGTGSREIAVRDREEAGGSTPEWPVQARRAVRRQRWFLVVAGVATLVSIGGLVTSTWVKSPAQQAAEQSPPPASVLTAVVESKVLTSAVAVRGTVTADTTIAVTGPGTAATGVVLTVTSAPKAAGDPVAPGDVVCEISGRPVLALPGDVPAYRDLVPGVTGKDVVELQDAMRGLGMFDGASDGEFGPQTQAAVQRLYASRGYAALTTSDINGASETEALTAAEATRRAAQRAVRDAGAAVAAADATTAVTAQQALTDAREDLDTATTALAQRQASVGVVVPRGEIVLVPTLPATVGSVGARVGTVLSSATSVLTLLTGQLTVHAVAPEGRQQLLSTGQAVTITDDVHARATTGTLTSIGQYTDPSSSADAAAGDGSGTSATTGTPGYPLVITTTAPLDSTWSNAEVLVQITTAATSTPVLVVPATAVATRSSGATFVEVLVDGRGGRDVAVVTGASADGMVQVTATTPEDLVAGDRVLVSAR